MGPVRSAKSAINSRRLGGLGTAPEWIVLRLDREFSKRAVQVNIGIMRTFVKLREMLATNEELARKVAQHDRQIAVRFDGLRKLLAPPATRKNPIGYIHPKV